MPLYPVSNVVVLVALVSLFIGMAFMPDYRMATIVGPIWIVALSVAYFLKSRGGGNRETAEEAAREAQ